MMDLFGGNPGGGISQAIADQGQIANTGLTQSKNAMLQAELPYAGQKAQADVMNTLASAALHTADAGLRNESLRQVKGMSEAMQRLGQGQDAGTSDQNPMSLMIDMAGKMVYAAKSVGAVNDMEKWAGTYSQLVSHDNAAKKNAADARRAEHAERISDYDEIARQVDIIQALPLDQQVPAYNQMNRYFTDKRKEPVPWGNMQWSPQTAEVLRSAALSQKDKANIEYKDQLIDARNQAREARVTHNIMTENLAQTRMDNQRLRDEAREKAGGKAIGNPNKSQVDAAAALIKDAYPVSKGANLTSLATDIAAGAKDIMDKNRGMRPSEALAKAFLDSRDSLDRVLGQRYLGNRPGQTPDLALPYVSDPGKRQVGSYYTNSTGQVGQWVNEGNSYGWKAVK